MQVHAAGGMLTWQLLVGSYADGLQIRPSAVTALAPRASTFSCNFPNISKLLCQVKSSQAGHAAGMSRIGAVARTNGPLFSGCRQPARLLTNRTINR